MARYVSVPAVDLREGYRDMEDFITTVVNKRLAELLSEAINESGAFFRWFRDVLVRFPEERERRFQFQNARLHQRVLGGLRRWMSNRSKQPNQARLLRGIPRPGRRRYGTCGTR